MLAIGNPTKSLGLLNVSIHQKITDFSARALRGMACKCSIHPLFSGSRLKIVPVGRMNYGHFRDLTDRTCLGKLDEACRLGIA
jgi:hypothetical protein